MMIEYLPTIKYTLALSEYVCQLFGWMMVLARISHIYPNKSTLLCLRMPRFFVYMFVFFVTNLSCTEMCYGYRFIDRRQYIFDYGAWKRREETATHWQKWLKKISLIYALFENNLINRQITSQSVSFFFLSLPVHHVSEEMREPRLKFEWNEYNYYYLCNERSPCNWFRCVCVRQRVFMSIRQA